MAKQVLLSVGLSLVLSGVSFAQTAANGAGGCFVGPSDPNSIPPGMCVNPSLAPVQEQSAAGATEAGVAVERAIGSVVVYETGKALIRPVHEEAVEAAHSVPKVGKIPVYGHVAEEIPVIGSAAGRVRVPTCLGQTPLLGPAVKEIPVVGTTIAGPPPPWLVGAVAVDTYYLPKCAPCGYTESSMFTMTDFNSPPRLRYYVNYLAPLPYTLPPLYAPAPGAAQVDLRSASIEPRPIHAVQAPAQTVQIEN